ncbi:hypothetical protein SALINJAH_275 [Bacillus phage SalinJah]|uniref:Uncharacterized protein n=1 Tax=Bacillus phage SalinJah TaxID=1837830 RepID=A0A173GBT4_9CAUD|nr:hypothetical protein SALINJAH_275 [Bacillus phage SalinJah]ANH50831.1 hypothetical protein SALINJAH_275 [Bacillus phage SalinJah]
MVKRLTNDEELQVLAAFTPLDTEKVGFTLTKQENNIVYCSLLTYNKETLDRLFQKSLNYELTYEDLETVAAALGHTSNLEVRRAWDILEYNEEYIHPIEGWNRDELEPRDWGYRLYMMLNNAYAYFAGKDVQYID